MKNKKILLAGLPKTGKTTFIAALWYMITNNQEGSVKLGSLLKGEHEYLNQIKDNWMRLMPMPRTNLSKFKGEEVVIGIEKTDNGEIIELEIPDFNGETFQDHFALREWRNEYSDVLDDINGILLFVDASNENNKPKLLVHQNEVESVFGVKSTNEGVEYVPWDHTHTSNQVKLVESLQFIDYHKALNKPIKIAVVISLWDVVEAVEYEKSPEIWLKENMPLLYQYLRTNRETFTSKCYGISSQGGNYNDRETLADLDPLERVIIRVDSIRSCEIEKPILWIAE